MYFRVVVITTTCILLTSIGNVLTLSDQHAAEKKRKSLLSGMSLCSVEIELRHIASDGKLPEGTFSVCLLAFGFHENGGNARILALYPLHLDSTALALIDTPLEFNLAQGTETGQESVHTRINRPSAFASDLFWRIGKSNGDSLFAARQKKSSVTWPSYHLSVGKPKSRPVSRHIQGIRLAGVNLAVLGP
jgi:hypothetical protein